MQLPPPNDPLVTPFGRVVEARGTLEPEYTREVPIARNIRPKSVRSVREMGSDGQTQTVVNAVLLYHLVGVGDNEIAHVMGTNREQIDTIKALPAFQETFAMLFDELIGVNSQSIQARIAAMAGRALNNLMDLANEKPEDVVKEDADGNKYTAREYFVPPMVILKANDSILDRAGLGADALFGKETDAGSQQLEIEITSASDNKTDIRVNVKR